MLWSVARMSVPVGVTDITTTRYPVAISIVEESVFVSVKGPSRLTLSSTRISKSDVVIARKLTFPKPETFRVGNT
jgi:hypothetical protein